MKQKHIDVIFKKSTKSAINENKISTKEFGRQDKLWARYT